MTLKPFWKIIWHQREHSAPLKFKFPIPRPLCLPFFFPSLHAASAPYSLSNLTCKSSGWCWFFPAGCRTQICWLMWRCSQKGSSGASSPRPPQPALNQCGDLYASKEWRGDKMEILSYIFAFILRDSWTVTGNWEGEAVSGTQRRIPPQHWQCCPYMECPLQCGGWLTWPPSYF